MSLWRQKYKVHPSADVFPMMSDEELVKLGEDIKRRGLRQPIVILHGVLVDGRNRLEAMERAGISTDDVPVNLEYRFGHRRTDPVGLIISLNIHRRHLTKQEQADLIVAAIKAGKGEQRKRGGLIVAAAALSRQDGEPIDDKRKRGGQVDTIKAAAVETGKQYGIGKRTVERSLAKIEGRPKKQRSDCDTPEQIWRRGLMYRAKESYGNALFEDWSDYAADDEMVEAAEKAAEAWRDLGAYLKTLIRKTERIVH